MTNIASMLDRLLLPAQSRLLRLASEASERYGIELFLVGGSVRDMLLERRPLDLDLSAVGATPDSLEGLFRELNFEIVARSQFGTLKLKVDDLPIDVAMARRESYSRPGALPSVSPGSSRDDLARRDFTVNAMAISLAAEAWGDLVDPFGGHPDLQGSLIRVLHPESFVDDATRILRAVRYAARLGFRIEPDTERLLRRDLRYLDTIKGDRVRHELERIFRERGAASMLGLSQELGVLAAIHPALHLDAGTLAAADRMAAEDTSGGELTLLSLLAYSLSCGEATELAARLSMDSRWAGIVGDTSSIRDSFARLRDPSLRPSQVYDLLSRFDLDAIEGCRLACDEPAVKKQLERYVSTLRHASTMLNGDDVIALGVQKGPTVGNVLRDLKAARLDGNVASREDEESFVRLRLGEAAR